MILIGILNSCNNISTTNKKKTVILRNNGGLIFYNDWGKSFKSEKASEHFENAMDFEKRGQSKDSWRELSLANSIEPNNIIILNALGLTESNLGHYRKSKEYLDTALNLDSTFVNTYINYATVQIRHGKYLKSIETLKKTIALNKGIEKEGIINYLLAYNYYYSYKYRTAKKHIESALYHIKDESIIPLLITLQNDIQLAISADKGVYIFDSIVNNLSYKILTYSPSNFSMYKESYLSNSRMKEYLEYLIDNKFEKLSELYFTDTNGMTYYYTIDKRLFIDKLPKSFTEYSITMMENKFSHVENKKVIFMAVMANQQSNYKVEYLLDSTMTIKILNVNQIIQ